MLFTVLSSKYAEYKSTAIIFSEINKYACVCVCV